MRKSSLGAECRLGDPVAARRRSASTRTPGGLSLFMDLLHGLDDPAGPVVEQHAGQVQQDPFRRSFGSGQGVGRHL